MDRAALQERFGIVGDSAALRHVLDRAAQVARTDITVLITGESGVGKELIASAVHGLSQRRHRPLVVVNCGAIPEGLIESELFGAEKGAYTGSVGQRSGYFEEADGGTIFLDEIGEMPLQAQVRLLRVLENGTYSRVGSSTTRKTDVRVVAATNKDLGREVAAGRFREDLYYRLSTVVLVIPPLRERPEDILPLFDQFLARFRQQYDAAPKTLDASARALLERYRWPGNVRELRNVAEQATVLVRGSDVSARDLQGFLRGVSASGPTTALARSEAARRDFAGEPDQTLVYRTLLDVQLEMRELKEQIAALVAAIGGRVGSEQRLALPPASATPSRYENRYEGRYESGAASAGFGGTEYDGGPYAAPAYDDRDEPPRRPIVLSRDEAERDPTAAFIEDVAFEIEDDRDEASAPEATSEPAPDPDALPTLESVERALIREALGRFEGNRRRTAEALGISERTLYRKIKEME
jgi:DNA-binding NtrC family response regulator